jgi:hypothetical protein
MDKPFPPGPKGEWGYEVGNLLEENKSIYETNKIQDGRSDNSKAIMEVEQFAISFNLKETYNHIPIHKSLHPLLGVAYRRKSYRFVGMPFGLNNASRVFSMIMRVVTKTIREVWNIKSVVYLDDLIFLHQDHSHLNGVGKEVAQFLQWLG